MSLCLRIPLWGHLKFQKNSGLFDEFETHKKFVCCAIYFYWSTIRSYKWLFVVLHESYFFLTFPKKKRAHVNAAANAVLLSHIKQFFRFCAICSNCFLKRSPQSSKHFQSKLVTFCNLAKAYWWFLFAQWEVPNFKVQFFSRISEQSLKFWPLCNSTRIFHSTKHTHTKPTALS